MKGSLLLIACLLAVVMMVAFTEGKSIAVKKQEKAVANEHESENGNDESDEENVEDASASGSGSGGGTHRRKILQ